MPTRLTKSDGIGAIIVVLGNITAILSGIKGINDFLVESFGYSVLRALLIIVVICITLGYTLGFSRIYKILWRRPMGLRRVLLMFVLILVIGGTIGANIVLVNSVASPEKILKNRLPIWTETIFINQAPNGGIKVSHIDPSSPPQVWNTAQCLKAVLSSGQDVRRYSHNVRKGLLYIEGARTVQPQEGWGYWEGSEYTVTEVIAWVSLAYTASLKPELGTRIWEEPKMREVIGAVERDLQLLANRQDASGGWSPIQNSKLQHTRTYSTVMAVWALLEARATPSVYKRIANRYDNAIQDGIIWLLNHYNAELGFAPNPNRQQAKQKYIGLTAQTLFVMQRAEEYFGFIKNHPRYREAKSDFLTDFQFEHRSLCLSESVPDMDQHFLPTNFVSEASSFLWFPWSISMLWNLKTDKDLSSDQRDVAEERLNSLLAKIDAVSESLGLGGMYQIAENLFCVSHLLREQKKTAASNDRKEASS